MKFRQIHLDFHTSQQLEAVGSKFNKNQFISALKEGHVDSITVFSKCHHGFSYHPTKAGQMHPGLSFDLLGEQLSACKEAEVNAPVYISAGLDERLAVIHPEWLMRRPDESTHWAHSFDVPGYHRMCFNTEYLDVLLSQIEEVLLTYHPCGIFLDIVSPLPCTCSTCRAELKQLGLNAENESDVNHLADLVYIRYMKCVKELVDRVAPGTKIFHNGGHIQRGRNDIINLNTHLELESLPTGGWGYDHFPLSAAYARTTDHDFLGMTGKFHLSWGEFGGFKHPNALIYETSLSLACGAKCSVGDQLHPLGKMNPNTYKLIGKAYSEVEKKEKWCEGAKHIADVALLSTEAIDGKKNSKADIGANRILLEGNYLYNVIDGEANFSAYKVIIVPDTIRFDSALTKKMESYLANGGKLFLSGSSGMITDSENFSLNFSVTVTGKSPYNLSYFTSDIPLTNGSGPYIMYSDRYNINPGDQPVVGYSLNPYFNRTKDTFTSHQHFPENPDTTAPAVTLGNKVAYVAWNIFTDYATKGALHLKELAVYLIDTLLANKKTLKTNLPDRGVLTLTKLGDSYINHLLFAHTTVRGEHVEVIEDVIPLTDITVEIKLGKPPTSVTLVPQMEPINFKFENEILSYTVPNLTIHQMVEIK